MTFDGTDGVSNVRRDRRRARRTVAGLGAAAMALVVWAVPSGAQTDPPPPTANFNVAGVRDLGTGEMISIETNVAGSFGFCTNPNGLGAELFLEAGDGAGMSMRHATVTPFVVPIHVGVIRITNPDPGNTIDAEMLTLGVARGTPVEFGQTGPASAEYGGVYFGPVGAGLVNWNYSGDVTCTDSVVMPILQPLIDGGTTGATPTTVPETTTTEVTTTTEATTTTVAPTTTESTTTTTESTTTTTLP